MERAPCPPKPDLAHRPLLSDEQVRDLLEVFKVLSNGTRLRLLHAMVRGEELCVSELCTSVSMKPQAVSNQLQRLSHCGIVSARRNGNQVLYRIEDPCVVRLLEYGLCLIEDARDPRG